MFRLLLLISLSIVCLCGSNAQICDNSKLSSDDTVIAIWNIGHFAKGRGYRSSIKMADFPKKLAEFQSFIYDSIAADILCVNEYSREFCNDSAKIIIAEDSLFNKFRDIKVFQQNEYVCNAIFSNKDLSNVIMYPFHYNESDRVDTNDRIIWYYYILADISIDGEDVKLVCTHLLSNSEKICQKQIEELIKICEKYEKIIICGDMNTWNYSKFKDAGYSFANDGSIVTWPTKSYALDNVFAKGLKISNVRVIKTNLSDHYAVSCSVSL